MSNQQRIMCVNKKIFVLIILQGLLSVSVGQTWTFPKRLEALVGSCVVIPCSFTRAKGSSSSRVVWFLYNRKYYIEIFNSEETSRIRENYRGRTSLASTEPGSCSLRIDNVTRGDAHTYFTGIDTKANSYYNEGTMTLNTRENPHQPVIHWNGNMTEGRPVTVTCAVEHTCLSYPPRLQWNKPGQKGREYQTNFINGAWRSVTELVYTPTNTDHGTEIQCTAIHHNGKTSDSTENLNIKYLQSVSIGQTWTFPPKIEALVGSCVVIPCSFTKGKDSTSQHIVWYIYDHKLYVEIFNTGETSKIRADYRGRTSLASVEPGSCSLRIDNVRRADADRYYPGIDEKTNSYYQEGTITLNTREYPHQPIIQWSGTLTEGRPLIITCSVEHTCLSNPPRLQWNKPGEKGREYQTDFMNGAWRSVSELVYTPTNTDRGTEIQCTAIHHNGQTSHSTKSLNSNSDFPYIAIYVVSGIICLLLSLGIGYVCFRKGKCRRIFYFTANQSEAANPRDPTYADLDKKDMSPDYDTVKDTTYTNLQKKNISPDYDEIKH